MVKSNLEDMGVSYEQAVKSNLEDIQGGKVTLEARCTLLRDHGYFMVAAAIEEEYNRSLLNSLKR
jgi:hypothetical protein